MINHHNSELYIYTTTFLSVVWVKIVYLGWELYFSHWPLESYYVVLVAFSSFPFIPSQSLLIFALHSCQYCSNFTNNFFSPWRLLARFANSTWVPILCGIIFKIPPWGNRSLKTTRSTCRFVLHNIGTQTTLTSLNSDQSQVRRHMLPSILTWSMKKPVLSKKTNHLSPPLQRWLLKMTRFGHFLHLGFISFFNKEFFTPKRVSYLYLLPAMPG